MNHNQEIKSNMPDWLLKEENYSVQADKDTFIHKSILSLLELLSHIKAQDTKVESKIRVNTSLKVAFTFLLLLWLSLSRSVSFVAVVIVSLLLVLSLQEAKTIITILKAGLLMTLFTFFIMLPAMFMGNGQNGFLITAKVFASITAVGLLSNTTKWGHMTSAFKQFKIPDLFLLVLDITIKYIVLLGEFSLQMLYALKLRSVGKNKTKYTSLSGIAGTLFIQSKEMAEEMYQAMECRGFSGEYRVYHKVKVTWADAVFVLLNLGIAVLFFILGRS